jgi:hypothetical protein
MTQEEDHSLTDIICPNCSFDIQAEITTTIRPADQSLQELFAGTLNQIICDQCAKEFLFETSLVFKNDDGSFFIFFNAAIAELGWKKAEEQMQLALNASLAELDADDRPECRLTLTRNEFIEKIAIHLANLDDKFMEYLKYHIFSQEALDRNKYSLLYDFSRSDNQIIEFSVIDKETGEIRHNTQTPHEMLEQIKNQLESDDCPVDIDEVFSGLYVQIQRLK